MPSMAREPRRMSARPHRQGFADRATGGSRRSPGEKDDKLVMREPALGQPVPHRMTPGSSSKRVESPQASFMVNVAASLAKVNHHESVASGPAGFLCAERPPHSHLPSRTTAR